MIKQTITYTDFNEEERTEDFWFHLDKADLLELQAMRSGGLRAYMEEIVKSDDNEKILEIFKMLILKSIGKRSPDGRQFIRNDEVRDEFRNTNAYSEFLFSLANDASSGAEFIAGILPANLEKDLGRYGVKAPTTTVELPADTSTNDAEAKTEPRIVEMGPVGGASEWTDFSQEQLLAMGQEDFDYLLNKIPGPKPALLLGIGMQRKQR